MNRHQRSNQTEKMYKSKLQEMCQKSHWSLPTYTTSKQGLDHNPSFSATVVVNGQSFHAQNFSKSSKEAQNDAAKIALDCLCNPRLPIPSASSFPQPSQLTSSGNFLCYFCEFNAFSVWLMRKCEKI